jgi:hypothetical protein
MHRNDPVGFARMDHIGGTIEFGTGVWVGSVEGSILNKHLS